MLYTVTVTMTLCGKCTAIHMLAILSQRANFPTIL
jgi:hypothetical protein